MVDLSSLPPPQPPEPPETRSAVYETLPRPLAVLIGGFLAVVAVVGLAMAGGSDGPPPAFTLFWTAVFVGNAYRFLFRLAVRLEVVGGVLRWTAPFRRGEIATSELVEVRAARLNADVAVLVHREGRLDVFVRRGFHEFAERLRVERPDLPIRVGWRGRFTEWVPGEPGPRRRGFQWRYALFLLPIGVFVLFITLWRPGDDPIVNRGDGPFFVGTIIVDRHLSLGEPTVDLDDPSEQVLAAVCHNYFDWLDDVTLNPELELVAPDDGLLRSAELLDGGGFEPTDAVLEAERLAVDGLSRTRVLEQMQDADWSSAELAEAEEYLQARERPPVPSTVDDYVFYLANVTTESVVVARLEVDLAETIGERPGVTRIGDISLRLPGEGTVYGVNESACWT